jgi:hypothetical protein
MQFGDEKWIFLTVEVAKSFVDFKIPKTQIEILSVH